jgi:TRAP-type C4-dicarboxylate transport system substrate-binding protein
MKKVDLLREKLAEYEVEDFGYLGDVIVLFANSERWNSLSESARSEIEELLDQQLDEEYGLELTDENGNVRGARKRLSQ